MAKILVVDDETHITDLLELFLTRKGFTVKAAANGVLALKALEEDSSIDLIILDYKMPKLDGAGVLRELRIRKFKKPVILLSGILEEFPKELDVAAFMMKPVDLNKLLEKINELLKLS